jgi:hypothetical protein
VKRPPAPWRLSSLLASLALIAASTVSASSQSKSYTWSDIDCGESRIVAWRGLKCRATNVVTNESRIGAFRQWAAFGWGPNGYYVHVFLWEAENAFSYVSAEETTADFVKWMFENGKSVSHMSTVGRYKDADYVSFRDGKDGRNCTGFRRLGAFQRGGYESVTGGVLCAPQGSIVTDADISLFIDSVRLRPANEDSSF